MAWNGVPLICVTSTSKKGEIGKAFFDRFHALAPAGAQARASGITEQNISLFQ
jgi:hypothetical protein